MSVGKNEIRVDAIEKVCGTAKYTADLKPADCLVGKVVHSTIANGLVLSIDTSEALKVPGVVKIVTCFDVPDRQYPTPGHPWSVETAHQDVSDRRLLAKRVHYYGDDIAAIIAKDGVSASRAARLLKIEYEEYPVATDVYSSMEMAAKGTMPPIHEEHPDNILVHSSQNLGDMSYEDAVKDDNLITLDKVYHTPTVQHCHIEVPVCFAYMDKGRIVVVSSTQIPHIVRRVIGQALGIDWGDIRVIKPYIGGGFGNKQDVLYEPLCAYLTTLVGGRCVMIEPSREETLASTRVRHAIDFHVRAAVDKDGTIVARKLSAYSNQGGYASHGHSIVANSLTEFREIYQQSKAFEGDAYTVYTNRAVGGAMRGYGIPQSAFASECMADDLALLLNMDPFEFRMKNVMPEGYKDPFTGIPFLSYGLKDCMEKGRQIIGWDEKRKAYKNQTGNIRRGIGMSVFCYKTGVHPISLETAACRMTLNQDGSVMLSYGATEIGQGTDTVLSQMAADEIGVSFEKIHCNTVQDTDVTPFDTGAYASRQTYVTGKAVKKTGMVFKSRILEYAEYMLKKDASTLDVKDNNIVDKESGDVLLSLCELATTAYYSLDKSVHITAEETNHCKENSLSSGACFADIEVDISLGKIKILKIVQVHDSGILINPQLATAQIHGGMSMGLGYGMSEELLYDEKGRPLNDNLLDYKMPTALDTPDLDVDFIQLEDPSGPYGNKALGEPPAIPTAPAIRNALLNATGVAVNSIPLHPQRLIEEFVKNGLLDAK